MKTLKLRDGRWVEEEGAEEGRQENLQGTSQCKPSVRQWRHVIREASLVHSEEKTLCEKFSQPLLQSASGSGRAVT